MQGSSAGLAVQLWPFWWSSGACRDLPRTAGRGLRGQERPQHPLCTTGGPRQFLTHTSWRIPGARSPAERWNSSEAERRRGELNDSRVLVGLKGAWQIPALQPEISSAPSEGQHRVLDRDIHRRAGPAGSPSVSLSCGCLWPAAQAGLHSRALFSLCKSRPGLWV